MEGRNRLPLAMVPVVKIVLRGEEILLSSSIPGSPLPAGTGRDLLFIGKEIVQVVPPTGLASKQAALAPGSLVLVFLLVLIHQHIV